MCISTPKYSVPHVAIQVITTDCDICQVFMWRLAIKSELSIIYALIVISCCAASPCSAYHVFMSVFKLSWSVGSAGNNRFAAATIACMQRIKAQRICANGGDSWRSHCQHTMMNGFGVALVSCCGNNVCNCYSIWRLSAAASCWQWLWLPQVLLLARYVAACVISGTVSGDQSIFCHCYCYFWLFAVYSWLAAWMRR